MRNAFFLLIVVLVLGSCKKTIESVDLNAPKLVWQSSVGERCISMHPVLSGNNVVFSTETMTGKNSPLVMFNKTTGVIEGKWNDFVNPQLGNIQDLEGKGIYENNGVLVFANTSRVHAVNVKTRQTVWKNNVGDYGESEITGLGNTIFQVKYKTVNGVDVGYIAKSNTTTGQWETVFTDTTLSDYRNTLQTPIPFIDKNNDTLLFIVQTKYRFPPQERKIDNLYCFNLSKRQLKYKIPITEPTGSVDRSIGYYPQIEGDKIIIRSGNKLLCFNVYSSNKIWEVENNDQQLSSSWFAFTIANEKVFAYSSGASVVCFDLATGSQLWKLPTNSGSLISSMTYFNGYLYYSTGGLEAINANTGQRVWDYSSPAKEFFDLNLRVDKAESKLYISDFKGNMYCFEALK